MSAWLRNYYSDSVPGPAALREVYKYGLEPSNHLSQAVP
jgi:hypothetical protein